MNYRQLILSFLALAVAFVSCRQSSDYPPSTINNDNMQDTIRILALGDSYTIGEGVDTSERWPVQLAGQVDNKLGAATEVQILATTGWTTGNLIAALDQVKLHGPFDMVTLMIGVNNQYQGRDTAEYRREFSYLLQAATDYAGSLSSNVIVVSIPDYGVTPFASNKDPEKIAAEIDLFNSIKFEETAKTNAKYVNVTPISRLAKDDLSLLAPDGLHPSGKMYAEWVALILPEAIEIIEKD